MSEIWPVKIEGSALESVADALERPGATESVADALALKSLKKLILPVRQI
jgi:hypothetical protein